MSVAVAVVLNIHDGHATAKKDIIIVMVVAFDLCHLCFVGPLSDGTIYVTTTYHITKIHTKRSNKKTKDENYVDGTHGYALIQYHVYEN